MIPTFTRRTMLRTIGGGSARSRPGGRLAGVALAEAGEPARRRRIRHALAAGGQAWWSWWSRAAGRRTSTRSTPSQPSRSITARPRRTGSARTGQAGRVLMGSPFKFAKQGKSGIEVSELYPELSTCIDDLCIVRSMATDVPNHEPALLMMNSRARSSRRGPSLGFVAHLRPRHREPEPARVRRPLPGHPGGRAGLWSNSFLPGIYQGDAHQQQGDRPQERHPLRQPNDRLPRGARRRQLEPRHGPDERPAPNARGDSDPSLEADRLARGRRPDAVRGARTAFDLGEESAATRDLYGKGVRRRLPDLPHRLAERAGPRSPEVATATTQPWDDHADILNHRKHAKASDRPIAALIKDPGREGLLDDTLIVWGSEFGRTPTSEGAKGRDHYPHQAHVSVASAGGGVKAGDRASRDRRPRLRRRQGSESTCMTSRPPSFT